MSKLSTPRECAKIDKVDRAVVATATSVPKERAFGAILDIARRSG